MIAQLASGEPSDRSLVGATRGAQEWLDALRLTGREVFAFLLWMEWSDAVARLDARHPGNLFRMMQEIGLYSLYDHRHPLATFPPMHSFHEQLILTTGRSADEVADEIIRITGL